MNGSSSYQTAADLLNRGFATPVRAERPTAPVLPAIVEPEPPVTVPPTRQVDSQGSAGPVTADAQGVSGSGQSRVPDTAMVVGAASVPIAAGALVLVLTMRRRKSPAGAHSRR